MAEVKQSNFAIRKCVRVHLIKNRKKRKSLVSANFIEEDEVLLAGFGHKGYVIGGILGVGCKAVKVANVSLLALCEAVKTSQHPNF